MEIKVRDLHKAFDGQKVLRGVTLDIEPGKISVIIGGSGTGKSVFLKHLIGLEHPDRGSVTIDGLEITGMREHDLLAVRQRIGMIFQSGALLASLPVCENVALGLVENGLASRTAAAQTAREKLKLVGLEDAYHKYPETLSGGMRKRVSIARALTMNPEGILYDEPTAGLDPPRSRQIEELILDVNRRTQATSVVVTHDMDCVRRIADHVFMLHEGQIIFSGTHDALLQSENPTIREFINR